jgi:hypothetical protein
MPSILFQHLKKTAFSLAFIVSVAGTLGLTGCADNPIADPSPKDPPSHAFKESYDDVWRAIQLALRKYPVRLNNIESGVLETDYVKGDQLFAEPVPGRAKQGMRYKILVRAVRGKIDGKQAVKVIVSKTPEIQPDFFTGYRPTSSDGLEEDVLLYRVGRYIELDKLLSKPANGGKPAIFNNDQ